jgi:hypothetical protein
VTGSVYSSSRLYFETRLAPLAMKEGQRVNVPTSIMRFAREAPFPPREWVERGYNVARWTEHASGGHFAALEEPVALVADIRDFFRTKREG